MSQLSSFFSEIGNFFIKSIDSSVLAGAARVVGAGIGFGIKSPLAVATPSVDGSMFCDANTTFL